MTRTPILYDPDCGFCRVCVALLLSWDRPGRLRPVALGTPEADDLLRGVPEAEQMASWHLAEPRWMPNVADSATIGDHPEVRSAGAAFPALFRMLPGGAPLARLTGRFPRASERGYRWVADHRTALGRPIPGAARRWADRVISESRADGR